MSSLKFFKFMNFLKRLFKDSAGELRNVRCLTASGILVAASVALGTLGSVSTPYFKVNFAFLPLAATGMLFGPVAAMIAAISGDILCALIKPEGAINFIYTFIAMFEGLVYGVFLYNAKIHRAIRENYRLIISQAIISVIAHMCFNTIANFMLGYASQASFWLYFQARAIKNLIELPLDIILLAAVLVPVKSAYAKIILREKPDIKKINIL